MKVVHITPSFKDETSYNYRINIGFLKKLSKYCDFISIEGYGKGITLWNAKTLYDMHKPDVMILGAHADCLTSYFAEVPCLKVMVAVDYMKMALRGNLYWYHSNKFDLVIHRGYYDKEMFDRNVGIPSTWLPYSADDKVFYPTKVPKVNKVGFVGTTGIGTKYYKQRQEAIKSLDEAGLIEYSKERIVGSEYPKALRKYTAYLTDTKLGRSEIYSPHAKAFEIMASGSILLTSPFGNMDLFFSGKDSMVTYKNDCSDIVSKAKELLEDKDRAEEIAINGHKDFLEKHTDELRVKELYGHLKNLLEGREVENKWMI